ncbi:glycosyl transferase, family 2 (plasmid) [Nitrobacter hamburgensis X14]|uniref:Glycosyl transferase, family 2 n=1 Tax=Nitrobacter hamburgensis (strain DSM 10229 / NCIMB 13809 / X14) TaxID=323097 RepID=Q1QG10_NITHX|nr:glycosyl transferase, family 2 [Nitrobacter hamburgensis X14]
MLESAADNSSILMIDFGLWIGLLVSARLLNPSRALDRMIFGSTAGALLVIYIFWCWHDTLPRLSMSAQSLWPHLFFTLEFIAVVYTLMSIVILFRSVDRSGQADRTEHDMRVRNAWPTVDVFICTYDEPLEVIERSILTALELDYPDFTVWVLDDTRRSWLRDYCLEAGARYITRSDNKAAKAGNLNNALTVTSAATNAPVILVLDADFAPQRHLLKRTVGLLADPGVAIVQTPQFYYNSDPIQHNLLATQSMVDDQRFFFDVFQPAKDAWGCAFCVGTSFVVRRDRLVEIGGFPSQAISEDINLTYTMLAHGYQTWWLNEKLSCGLSAEGIPEYITQRSRWCLGTIQVALLRDGPLFGRGHSAIQRLHYIHGILNWLCKPFLVLLLIAPMMYWFAGLPAFEADYLAFLRYGAPAILGQTIYMAWISRSRTVPLFMEATHAIVSFAVSATLISAVVKPFGRPFKITDKGGDRSAPKLRWKLALTFGLIAFGSAASIAWAFLSPYAASEISSRDYFNLLWAGISMLIAFIAFVACFELPRGDKFFPVNEAGALALAGNDHAVPCRVAALSTSSVELTWTAAMRPLTESAQPWLYMERLGWVAVTVAAATGKTALGHLHPTFEQRRRLVIWLFGLPPSDVVETVRITGVIAGLVRRGFRGR